MTARGTPGGAERDNARAPDGVGFRGRGAIAALGAQVALAFGLLGVVLVSPRAAWAEPLWLSTTVGGALGLGVATAVWWRGGSALPLFVVDLWFAVCGYLLGRGIDPALDSGPDPLRAVVDGVFGPLATRYPVAAVWLAAGLLGVALVAVVGRVASSKRE